MEPEFPLRRPVLAAVLAFGAGRIELGALAAELVDLEWPAQDAVDLAELLSDLRREAERDAQRRRAAG